MIPNTRRCAIVLGLLASVSLPRAAMAQNMTGTSPMPPDQTVDRNGVNVTSDQLSLSRAEFSIGDQSSGMTYQRYWTGTGWTDNVAATLSGESFYGGGSSTTVSYQGDTDTFDGYPYGGYVATAPSGATLSYDFGAQATLYTSASGRRINFPNVNLFANPGANAVTEITERDGEIIKLNYTAGTYQSCTVGANCTARVQRLQSATSTTGYQVKYEYESDDRSNLANVAARTSWQTVSKVTALNNAVDNCDPFDDHCSFSRLWPNITNATSVVGGGSKYFTVTDTLGNATRYTIDANNLLIAIKRPSSSTDNVTYTHIAPASKNNRVYQVNNGGDVWTYGLASGSPTPDQTSVSVTDPFSHYREVVSEGGLIFSSRDEAGHITQYHPQGEGHYAFVGLPEGNAVVNTFDARGNLTQARRTPKGGTGLADIVSSAVYPTTCANALTCNKPTSTTDARGNVTDYTYDPAHGGLLTVTRPAAAPGGVRPQTRYSYTSLYAWYRNAGGTLTQAPSPIWRLTGISECRTLASCVGTADETRTTIAYGTAGVANNLLATVVTVGAGDGSVSSTTTYAYDAVGNRVSTDGPLAGSADTTVTRYDGNRQVVGVISADPDGAGSLPNLATRLTYNADGQVVLAEQGTTNGQSDAAWAGFASARQVATSYDAKGRKATEVVQSGGTSYAVTQYSYDARDRMTCVAQRMNASAWGSLPASACTAQAAGGYGPDRIAQLSYDAVDQVLTSTTAQGTAAAATESASYNDNGTVATSTDAMGNRTAYGYDGFDRLGQVRYPLPTTPGSSSTTDYEAYGYDAGDNVTSRRKRDGRVLSYGYDALDRMTVKVVPDGYGLPASATRDVYYGYDLQGRQAFARFDGVSGEGIANGYDGLGRLASATTTMGGTSRTLGYGYDVRGNLTAMSYPDGQYVSYYRDGVDRLYYTALNGATPLFYPPYDAQGRVSTLYRWVSGGWYYPTSYSYDAISRLAGLSHNIAGGSVATTYAYNPASQIVSRARDNDAYAWPGYVNGNRSYAANGLNQYTSAGPATFSYDGNGNLTGDGTNGYSYDVENRLVGASNGAVLSYDPLGRLDTVTRSGATTRFVYDGDRLAAEYDGSGNLLRRYVHGDGTDDPVVWYEGPGTTSPRYLYADERGSVTAVADAGGNVTNLDSYDEHGIPAAGNVGRFQYTGQAWLAELGMYYYKARMYSPTLGRFMQTDPIGYADGMNAYAYVGNDPVNRRDPSGTKTTVIPTPCGKTDGTVADECFSVLPACPDNAHCYKVDQLLGPALTTGVTPQKMQALTSCQRSFLVGQLSDRGLPSAHLGKVRFVSGLDANAGAFTRNAFNGGASAVTQGNTIYVQPTRFNDIANFRSATGYEEIVHTAQFSVAGGAAFYQSYGLNSIMAKISGLDGYNGNAYEAFAKGASNVMFKNAQGFGCPK